MASRFQEEAHLARVALSHLNLVGKSKERDPLLSTLTASCPAKLLIDGGQRARRVDLKHVLFIDAVDLRFAAAPLCPLQAVAGRATLR